MNEVPTWESIRSALLYTFYWMYGINFKEQIEHWIILPGGRIFLAIAEPWREWLPSGQYRWEWLRWTPAVKWSEQCNILGVLGWNHLPWSFPICIFKCTRRNKRNIVFWLCCSRCLFAYEVLTACYLRLWARMFWGESGGKACAHRTSRNAV